ncbi:MAG: zinc-ribbon domain-containing protein [Alphaproteobacteria bacterium]|nr:zinc-ribbon domain-containing protein [Alphaproteobacteria bacterium]
MLVVCPKCFTQYAISDEIRIKKGQKFHCSACQNYFVLADSVSQNESDDGDIIPTVTSVMETVNQPPLPAMGVSVSPKVESQNEAVSGNDVNDFLHVSPSQEQKEPQFEEPLNLLANERPNPNIRLDTIPEAFQPVKQTPKTTSFLGTVFWLCVVAGICSAAYMKKDFLIEQLDAFILNQLDKGNVSAESVLTPSVKKTHITKDIIASVEPKGANVHVKPIIDDVKPQNMPQREKLSQSSNDLAVKKDDVQQKPIIQSVTENVQMTQTKPSDEKETAQPSSVSAKVEPEQTDVIHQSESVKEDVPVVIQKSDTDVLVNEVPQVKAESEFPTLSGQLDTLTVINPISQELPKLDNEQMVAGESSIAQPEIVREQAVIPETFASLAEQPVKNLDNVSKVLEIRNISYIIAPNEVGVMRLMIKGELANTELTPLVIPELKAVVYNDEDTVIARKRIIISQPKIEGNSVQEFFSSVVPAPERVSHVEVVFDE